MITTAAMVYTPLEPGLANACKELERELEGVRYGTLDDVETRSFKGDIVRWLREEL